MMFTTCMLFILLATGQPAFLPMPDCGTCHALAAPPESHCVVVKATGREA